MTPKLASHTFTDGDGRTETFIESSGNVFADLGLENADELQLKSGLASEMSAGVESRGWTQVEAARA